MTLTSAGQANTCIHGSGTGIDTTSISDPAKVWACDHCGLRWRQDGLHVDDPAHAKVERVEALRVHWATATGNATDFDYGRWFRAAASQLRAALADDQADGGAK